MARGLPGPHRPRLRAGVGGTQGYVIRAARCAVRARVWGPLAAVATLGALAVPASVFACAPGVTISTSPSAGPPGSSVTVAVQGVYSGYDIVLSLAGRVLWSGVSPGQYPATTNMTVPVTIPQEPAGTTYFTAVVQSPNGNWSTRANVPFAVTAPPAASQPAQPPVNQPAPVNPAPAAVAPARSAVASSSQPAAARPGQTPAAASSSLPVATGAGAQSGATVPAPPRPGGVVRTSGESAHVAIARGSVAGVALLAAVAALVLGVGAGATIVVRRRRG